MAKDGENLHIINVYYVGAGNFTGASCVLYSARFHKTKYIKYDYSARDILGQACNWLTENGFKIVGHGEAKKGYYIITSTFKTI